MNGFPTSTVIVMCLLSAFLGWMLAHKEIATECKRQGNFYVGKEIFECRVKP